MSLVTTCVCKSINSGREDLLNDIVKMHHHTNQSNSFRDPSHFQTKKWGGLGRAPKAPAGANPLSKDNKSSFFHLLALRFPMSLVTTCVCKSINSGREDLLNDIVKMHHHTNQSNSFRDPSHFHSCNSALQETLTREQRDTHQLT